MVKTIEVNREYRVQSPKENSYRVTIPKKLVEEVGIEDSKELGVEVEVSSSRAVVDYKLEPDEEMVTRELVKPHNMVRIPAAIGNSLQIGREMVNWKMIDDDETTLRILTPYIPPRIGDQWEKIGEQEIEPTVDEDREHFSVYLNKDIVDELGWCNETQIGFIVSKEENEEPVLRCQPVEEEPSNMRASEISCVTSDSDQLRFYLPRSLARAMDFVGEEVEVLKNKKAAAIVPKSES